MKKMLLLIVVSLFVITACGENKEENKSTNQPQMAAPTAQVHKVIVKETMDAQSYTYAYVEENGKEFWIAVTKMDVNVGDPIYYTNAMEMKDFESTTLKRKFDSILFVADASLNPITPKADASAHTGAPQTGKKDVKVEKAAGGVTVAEIYKKKDDLKGKTLAVKGKVTKYNGGIMGRNWIHIQDGSEYDGKFDLLVTSHDDVKVGDEVTVEGVLALDQDFGYGYSYELLLEDAKVKK